MDTKIKKLIYILLVIVLTITIMCSCGASKKGGCPTNKGMIGYS